MKKAEALEQWRNLPEDLPVLAHFEPIAYKSTGSSYGACGVRIDGSPEFVDAVLSRLKDLIDAENHVTRLELSRKAVEARPGRPLEKAVNGAEVCYIRCHVRGRQGAMASAFFDKDLAEPTTRFAAAIGVTD